MRAETPREVIQIARGIDCALRLVLSEGHRSRWCEALLIKCNKFGELKKGFRIIAFPAFLDKPGEVVRVYTDLDDFVLIPVIRQAINMVISPFLVAGWKIAAKETGEGFKICLADKGREDHFSHRILPVSNLSRSRSESRRTAGE